MAELRNSTVQWLFARNTKYAKKKVTDMRLDRAYLTFRISWVFYQHEHVWQLVFLCASKQLQFCESWESR
jgi:hypothetical protein